MDKMRTQTRGKALFALEFGVLIFGFLLLKLDTHYYISRIYNASVKWRLSYDTIGYVKVFVY